MDTKIIIQITIEDKSILEEYADIDPTIIAEDFEENPSAWLNRKTDIIAIKKEK